MRSCFAIPVLALGLACLMRPSPAQFSAFTEPTNSGSRIGVSLRDIDADRAAMLKLGSVTGVEVMAVQNGSPAEQAGIKAGDVLLSYNSESIMGAQQLGRLVSETPVGRKVKIEYWRDGKATTVTAVTAAARPINVLNFDPNEMPDLREALLHASSFPAPIMVWTNQRFGIECEALNAQESQLADYFGVKHGVLIRAVVKDSPASKAGMRAGDVVTQIGDRAVADPKDIASYLRMEQRHQLKPMAVELTRDHKPLTVKVNLAQDGQE